MCWHCCCVEQPQRVNWVIYSAEPQSALLGFLSCWWELSPALWWISEKQQVSGEQSLPFHKIWSYAIAYTLGVRKMQVQMLWLHRDKCCPFINEVPHWLPHWYISVHRANSPGSDGDIGCFLHCSVWEEIFGASFHSLPFCTTWHDMAQCAYCLPDFPLFYVLWCVINKQRAFYTKEKQ